MKRPDRPFSVVVVDDDFMIARVHAKFIESQSSYRVVGTAHNAKDTLTLVQQKRPDLLLLDVYLPDQSGLDVLVDIRSQKIPCDVILITAAKEIHFIEEGFRLGIFDYLIKPFNLERLSHTLQKYAEFKASLHQSSTIDQGTVDHLKQFRAAATGELRSAESGIDPRTLARVEQALRQANRACTADEVARLCGVSRSTARTYLDYLVKSNMAVEELSYGSVGRPRRLFRIAANVSSRVREYGEAD